MSEETAPEEKLSEVKFVNGTFLGRFWANGFVFPYSLFLQLTEEQKLELKFPGKKPVATDILKKRMQRGVLVLNIIFTYM